MAHALQSGLRDGGLRRGGLHAGLGNGSIFNIASLDLNFAKYKNIGSLVTFTRASSGTFVGSDGVLRTAVTNLSLRSEKLDEAGQWSVIGSGATLTATTDVAAPNGAMTAWTLTSSGAAAQIQQAPTGISGATYTGSFYIRRRSGTGTVNIRVSENINTPLVGVTSEWQRFSFTATSTSTTIRLGVNLSGIADAVDLWGAQLEQSTTVGEYIPTTSVINSAPRFDHNPTTGESLGLLVREQRTNLLLRSEEFGTTWTATRASVSTDATLAPSGATTADKLVEDTTATNTHQIQQTVTLVANTTYATSFYIKSSERTELRLLFSAGTDGINAAFNLSTGVATAQANTGLGVIASATLTPVGNGWFRATATGIISPLSTSATLTLRLLSSGSNSYTGDGTSGLFLWGAQLEAGAFATSYIPTTTATVTRAADVASITGSNFSSWANNNEGTIFSDSSIIASQIKTQAVWELSGGTVLSSLRQPQGTANQFRAVIGGTFTGSPGTGASLTTGVTLAAVAYSGTAGRLQIGSVGTDATGSTLDATSLSIGSLAGASQLNGWIKRLCFWPARLPDATLQQITQ